MVELVKILNNELKAAFKMHRQGFMPTFKKYHDRINPIFMPYKKFLSYHENPSMHMFWIISDSLRVGQIWIGIKGDSARLARIFVLPEFQNQGIAQQAIRVAENLYPEPKRWQLDTIKQEKNNCHLYEKMGYRPTGSEQIINKRMTIINYGKEGVCNE